METLFSLGALPKIHLFDKPVDKQAVKEFLEGRIKELADKFGFVYNKVTIRNQKTRWGSCSGKNNINLNMQLMNIPNHLIDYVILHCKQSDVIGQKGLKS